ncbi:MAG: GNAT family N-acetyltransferase [Lactobacillales bacterium]|jgi:predicted GNAT family N-acyltransferase|nr:GNAT family N-acetyltransferase [Lactobacillales bacterium]
MKIANTRDTLSSIYLDAIRLRHEVFMVEQKVPVEIEIDENEAFCVHFVLYDENDMAKATCRLFPNNEDLATIQRLAVLKPYRSEGLDLILLKEIELFATNNEFSRIELHVQLSDQELYEKHGYVPFGKEFIENNVLHIAMAKEL